MTATDRRSGCAADASARATASGDEILQEIDSAMLEAAELHQQLNRALICGLPLQYQVDQSDAHLHSRFGAWYAENQESELLDQAAFQALAETHRNMHGAARALARLAGLGPVPVTHYDQFLELFNAFQSHARRITAAFQRAVSDLDPLTGIHNRAVMRSELERERERALRTGEPAALALCDIDHFKRINDTYGHSVGDTVLRAVVDCFLAMLRPYDSLFRYGGEEFLILLPGTDAATAGEVLERLRSSLESRSMDVGTKVSLMVTASFGFAVTDESASVQDLTDRADRALYAAKEAGRNRIVAWPELSDGGIDPAHALAGEMAEPTGGSPSIAEQDEHPEHAIDQEALRQAR